MKNSLVDVLFELYKGAIEFIQGGVGIMGQGIASLSGISDVIDSVHAFILPVAWIILSILCLIDIIDVVTRKGEEMRWEDIIRILIKLVICKSIMEVIPYLMDAMFNSATELAGQINQSIDDSVLSGIRVGIANTIKDDPTGGFIKTIPDRILQILQFLLGLLIGLAVYISGLVVYVIAYGRIMELLVLQALSPLPCAFAGWQETKDIPKKFTLSYFAVCLQGVTMIICVRIYILLISNSTGNTMFLIFTVTLVVGITKSGNWAKQIVGLV